MKNIYLLVGPSGSGKSSVARELEKRYGFGEIQSYTERPRRYLATMATATAFRSRW